ncbi:hypothetical protein BOX15_Mlig020974g2 [Macrostomum lignano]|uniref:Uncharacterized protein n=1 Tax=Macrostomum lignano TaxID=282301 RepID=A0A267E8L8_9PLAT|nr:hypothetical protein BOX15_Mlig020974g2 [Macrostomum lignano]
MYWIKLSANLFPMLLTVALLGHRNCCYCSLDAAADGSGGAAEDAGFKLDANVIRDAIASALRSGDGLGAGGTSQDGYAEAAQEYLEHVQAVLTEASAPIEMYIREQLADLDTLSRILAELSKRKLNQNSALRLAARLLKGPAKELVLPTLTGQHDEAEFDYSNSKAAQLITDALKELNSFLSESEGKSKDTDSLTDRLKAYGEKLGSGGPIREYLDAVLDRMLELEGRKVRFNVEFPNAKGKGEDSTSSSNDNVNDEAPSLGEPRVSRLPDTDDQDGDKSTSSAEEDGGKPLLDQVLCRKAAETIAARLAKDDESGKQRIEELRRRQYQPAGLDAMLEAIEGCL